MKTPKTALFALTLASCGHTGTIALTPAQIANDSAITQAPFDTLAAYRKMPGQPKTVYVKPHWRKARQWQR